MRFPSFIVIQIGAHDGFLDDPIHDVLKASSNFEGVMVEPLVEPFQKLQNQYKGSAFKFENSAIYDYDGVVELTQYKKEVIVADWQAGCTTALPLTHLDMMSSPSSDLQKVAVACMSWRTFVKKYGIQEMHLLQIDVEGYDFELIKQIDFTLHHPHIIHYEHLHLHDQVDVSLSYLESFGYIVKQNAADIAAYSRRYFTYK